MTYGVLAVLAAIMIVDTRAKRVLVGYVAIAVITTAITLPAASTTLEGLALFGLATVLKVILAPIGILWFGATRVRKTCGPARRYPFGS